MRRDHVPTMGIQSTYCRPNNFGFTDRIGDFGSRIHRYSPFYGQITKLSITNFEDDLWSSEKFGQCTNGWFVSKKYSMNV